MMERIRSITVHIGSNLVIGGGNPVVVQTMCNTHTDDVEASVAQCLELAAAGAQMVRLTVPGTKDIPCIRQIHNRLRVLGCKIPLVADIHFSSETAIAVAPYVEKVRINPGNFNPDHNKAREQFARLLEVCRSNGTAVRVGLNHGSLGRYITDKYGNTPQAMAIAAMEWLEMCIDADFFNVVVSLKASNTVIMVEAYRELVRRMKERGVVFPLHLGVTEAGNGVSGRIKSCVGIASLLREGIGDTIRVSLTEPPVNEIPVAQFLANYAARIFNDRVPEYGVSVDTGIPVPPGISEDEARMLSEAVKWGPDLLNREVDDMPDSPWKNEILQAARRRFSHPEYIACPGCGRTMYHLQDTFEEVKRRTSHLKGMVIAVMGCIVNGPGEMADADWGYVGEGNGKVSIYHNGEPVLRHIPESEAIDRMLELLEK